MRHIFPRCGGRTVIGEEKYLDRTGTNGCERLTLSDRFDSFGILNFFNFDILDFEHISCWFVRLKIERLQRSGSGTRFAFLTRATRREPKDHKEGEEP
jgi:hypothetical protein